MVKTHQVVKSRGQHCGDIELTGYLANEAGPVPLVVDRWIVHDRVGSSVDPSLNGHLKYPNNLDQSLNESDDDKIRKYRPDYNNKPPNTYTRVQEVTLDTDPLMWWKQHVQEFPRLARMTRHLAVPSTSASPERLFSSVGLVKSDFRGSLLDSTLIDVMWTKQVP